MSLWCSWLHCSGQRHINSCGSFTYHSITVVHILLILWPYHLEQPFLPSCLPLGWLVENTRMQKYTNQKHTKSISPSIVHMKIKTGSSWRISATIYHTTLITPAPTERERKMGVKTSSSPSPLPSSPLGGESSSSIIIIITCTMIQFAVKGQQRTTPHIKSLQHHGSSLAILLLLFVEITNLVLGEITNATIYWITFD